MKIIKILIVLILLVCVVFFFLGMKSQKGSAIGLVDGQLAPCPSSPNCVSSEAGTVEKKGVAPLEGSMEAAKSAIIALGGKITLESASYLSATFSSSLFRFVDDVELRASGDGKIHIRSASRVGYSDRGENKKRVEAIRAKMNS